jgi:hypothetical protein
MISKKNKMQGLQLFFSWVYPVLILGFAYLSFRFPTNLVYLGAITTVPSICLIYLAVSKLGKLRLGQENQSLLTWYLKLSGLQLLYVGVCLASVLAFFFDGPSFANQQVSEEVLREALSSFSWLHWILFPLGSVLAVVLSLGMSYWFHQRGPFYHQMASKVLANLVEPQQKAFAETMVYSINVVSLSFLFGMIGIILTQMVQQIFGWVYPSVLISVSFTVLSFSFFFIFLFFKSRLISVFEKSKSPYFWAIFLASLVIGLAMITSSGLIESVARYKSLDLSQYTCACHKFFDNTPVATRWTSFYYAWLLISLPLFASLLIKISQGRSLSQLILGISFMPVCLAVAIFFCPNWLDLFQWLGFWENATELNGLLWRLILLGVVIGYLWLITRYKRNSSVVHIGALEEKGNYVPGRLKLEHGTKLVGFRKSILPIIISGFGIVLMHLLGGWYVLQIQLLMLTPMVLYGVCACCFVLVMELRGRDMQGNNSN